MKIKNIYKYFYLSIVIVINSSIISLAQTQPQDLFDRNIRSVYYETEGYGSQSLNITLGELVNIGLKPGVWKNEKENIWVYYIYSPDINKKINCMSLYFTVVDEIDLKKYFEKDVILTSIVINGHHLKKKEVFDFILPAAIKINSEKKSNDMNKLSSRFVENNYYLNQ